MWTMADTVQMKVRVDRETKDRFKADVSNMSETVEELIQEYLADEAGTMPEPDPEGPDEKHLSDAYDALLKFSNDDGYIAKDHAETFVAQATGIKAGVVRQTILDRLEGEYIFYSWGNIRVMPREAL